MPLYTEHLNLAKPSRDERYNIAVPNSNMDILDETIRELREENQALREELSNKANIGTPKVCDLELLNGCEPYPKISYCVDQFGRGEIFGSISSGERVFSPGVSVEIGKLPEYFTAINTSAVCIFRTGGSLEQQQYVAGVSAINADGSITVFIPPDSSEMWVSYLSIPFYTQ